MDRGQEQKSGRSGGAQEEDAAWYRLGPVVEPATTESDVLDVPDDTTSSAALPEPVETSSGTQQENLPSATPIKSSESTSTGKPSSRSSVPVGRTLEMDFKIKDRAKPQSVTITLRLEPNPSRSENDLDKETCHNPRHRSVSVEMMEDSESTMFTGTFPIDPFDDSPSSKRSTRKSAESARQKDKTSKMEDDIPEDDERQAQHEEVPVASTDSAMPSAENEEDHQGLTPRLTEPVRKIFQDHPHEDAVTRAEHPPIRKDQAVSVHGIWPPVSSEVQVGASLLRLPSISRVYDQGKGLMSAIHKDAVEGLHILHKDVKATLSKPSLSREGEIREGLKTVSWARKEAQNRSFSDAMSCCLDKSDPHRKSEDSYFSPASSPDDSDTVLVITNESVNGKEWKNAVPQMHDSLSEKKSFRMLSVSQEHPHVNKYAPSAPPLSHERVRKHVPRSQKRSKGEGSLESGSGESDTDTSQENSGLEMSVDSLSQERSLSEKSDPNLPHESPKKEKTEASLTQDVLRTQSRVTFDVETDPVVGSIFGELDSKHSHAVGSTKSEDEEIEMDNDDLTFRHTQSNASSAVSVADTSSTLSNEPLPKSRHPQEAEVRDIEPNVSDSVRSSISKDGESLSAEEDDMLNSMTTLTDENESDVTDGQIKNQDPHRKNYIKPKIRFENSSNTPLPVTRSLSEKSHVDTEEVHLVPSGMGRTGGLPVTTVFSVPTVLSNLLSIHSKTRIDFEKKRFVDDASFIHKTSSLKDVDGTDSNITSFQSAGCSGRDLSYQGLNTKVDAEPPSSGSALHMNILDTPQKSASNRELRVQPKVNEVTTVPGVVNLRRPQSDALEVKTTPGIYKERLNPEKLDIIQDRKVTTLEQTSSELMADTLDLQNVEDEKVDLLKDESLVMQKESGLIDKTSCPTVSVSSRITIGSSFDGEGFIPANRGQWSDSPENGSTVSQGPSSEQGRQSYIDELFDFFLSEPGNTIKVKMPPSLSGSEIKKYLSQPRRDDTQEVSQVTEAQLGVTKMMPEVDLKEHRKVAFVPQPFVVKIPSTSHSRDEVGKRKPSFITDKLNLRRSPILIMHTSTNSSQNVFQDTSNRETESTSEAMNVPEGRPSSHSVDHERSQELLPETGAQENTLHSPQSEPLPYSAQEVTAYATVIRPSEPFKTENQPEILIPPESESRRTHESAAISSTSSKESTGMVNRIHSTLHVIYSSGSDSALSTEEMNDGADEKPDQIEGAAVDIPEQQQVDASQVEGQKLPEDCKEGMRLPEKDRMQLLYQDRDQKESSLEAPRTSADIAHASVPNLELREDRPVMSRDRAEILQSDNVLQTSEVNAATECGVSLPVEPVSDTVPAISPTSNNSEQSIPESAFQSLTSDLTFKSLSLAPEETPNIGEFDGKELKEEAPSVQDDESSGNEEGQHPPRLLVSHTEQKLLSALEGEDTTYFTPRSVMNLPSNNDLGERENASELSEDSISTSSDEQIHPETNTAAELDTRYIISSKFDAGSVGNEDRASSITQYQRRIADRRTEIDQPFPIQQSTMPFKIGALVVSLFEEKKEGGINGFNTQGSSIIWERVVRNANQNENQGGTGVQGGENPAEIVENEQQAEVTRGVEESPVEDQRRGSTSENFEDAQPKQNGATDAAGRSGAEEPTAEVRSQESPEENQRRESSKDNAGAELIWAKCSGQRTGKEETTTEVQSQISPVEDQGRESSNENFEDALPKQNGATYAAGTSGAEEPIAEVQSQESPAVDQRRGSSNDNFQDAKFQEDWATYVRGKSGEVQGQESPAVDQTRRSTITNFEDVQPKQIWATDAAGRSGVEEQVAGVQNKNPPVEDKGRESSNENFEDAQPKQKWATDAAGRSGAKEPTAEVQSQEPPTVDQRRGSSSENFKDAKFQEDWATYVRGKSGEVQSHESPAVDQRRGSSSENFEDAQPKQKLATDIAGKSGTEEPTSVVQKCSSSNLEDALSDQFWESDIKEEPSIQQWPAVDQRRRDSIEIYKKLVEKLKTIENGSREETDIESEQMRAVVSDDWVILGQSKSATPPATPTNDKRKQDDQVASTVGGGTSATVGTTVEKEEKVKSYPVSNDATTLGLNNSDISNSDDGKESDSMEDQGTSDAEEAVGETQEDRQEAVKVSAEGVDKTGGAEFVSGEQERRPTRREGDFERRTVLINLGGIFGPTVDQSVLELVIVLKQLWSNRPSNTCPPGQGEKK